MFPNACQISPQVQVMLCPGTIHDLTLTVFSSKFQKWLKKYKRYKAQDYYAHKDNLHSLCSPEGEQNTVKVLPGNCGSPTTNSILDITPMVIIWLMGNHEKGMLLVVIWKLQSNQGQLTFKLEEGKREREAKERLRREKQK